ncbi:helix-turn-helix domain-containing protein [Enterococcus durans]|uniref:helix-turn-helix domain-containing protein n=1 Tax=Enterococcus durans TaxID=53345 RepID=UPI0034A36CAA
MITFERIKELAKKQGKSLNKVEEDLGYGKNVLYRLKNSNPSTERLQEIADYFDVSVDYLLGREKKETPKHVDLSEDDTVFSFDGKEISKETMRKAIAIAKALEENE